MTTLQRSTSRTLHLRSRDPSGGGSSRPVQRSGQPVVLRLEPVRHAATETAPSSLQSTTNTLNMATGKPVSSQTLLRGAKVVQIMHNGEAYQLRATRHGKLILTK